MSTRQKIVYGRGPSNINLGIFVCSFDVCRASKPVLSINYALIVDNVPYNGREIKQYALQCGINIITTSPTYSRQANGLAEKAVHIIKNLLRKECNLIEGLMEYRSTRISNFPYSPNLFSGQIRTRVPVHPLVLVSQTCHDIPELLEERQAKYKEFYDRQGSKQLPQLREGDNVRIKKPGDKHLSPAVVTGKHKTVTMQSSVDSPSVTRESAANLEPDPPDTNASSSLYSG